MPINGKVPERVAIVGLGPSSYSYIQAVDAAGDRKKLFDETWTFNTYSNVIDSDRLFHMDDFKVQERRAEKNVRVRNMLESLKRYPNPIYTSFPEKEYPTSVSYPLADIVQTFNNMYFTTTPPYALAYALMLGVKHIMLYGMDYTWPGSAEAEGGRSCMEYWIGRGQAWQGKYASGVQIGVPPSTTLMGARDSTRENISLYGYDRVKISLKDLGDGHIQLVMTPKELPSAEEIEARYFHRRPGTGVALTVVE